MQMSHRGQLIVTQLLSFQIENALSCIQKSLRVPVSLAKQHRQRMMLAIAAARTSAAPLLKQWTGLGADGSTPRGLRCCRTAEIRFGPVSEICCVMCVPPVSSSPKKIQRKVNVLRPGASTRNVFRTLCWTVPGSPHSPRCSHLR